MRLQFISSAYQRCRLSDQNCRLAVILTRPSSSHRSLRISTVSDTGIRSRLEEFQNLRFSSTDAADNWDGTLSIKTTSISDTEIHNYQINFKETGSSRITKLPSNTKNGAKFRHANYLNSINLRLTCYGSEVRLSYFVSLDLLLAHILSFVQKNVAIQLVAEDSDAPELRYEKVFLANECKQIPVSASNLELLKSGIEDYVLKHGNNLSDKCNSCFPSWGQLKVGSGVACCTENRLHTELVMEAVIVMSNISMQNTTCFREYGNKTEVRQQVLFFKEFSPCTISQSSMKALKSIDWKAYGLNLGGIVEKDGVTLLEWENFPTDTNIDIALHSYHKQYPALSDPFLFYQRQLKGIRIFLYNTITPASRKMSLLDRNLVKRAVKLSLDDLKVKHSGDFLSSRALQIRSYAPDLAKTIAGLILSSSDLDFKGECFSLLGLQSQEVGTEIVGNCIEERIVSVIEKKDKKPYNNTQEVAPFLFEEDPVQEVEFEENDISPLDSDL
ncbi:hypothetical protein RJT34_06630 [Clitoria ternatea]|uniref:Type 2 DNA topoisomerase 6 subunit B-like n=1 Tax=Clitoria ternatea TaxID=43366 RepID=A0AAN9PTS6_CLITE